jgi:hypothetical protein
LALDFEWDPRKAASNLVKHRVSFEEAATAFGDPLGRIARDARHSSQEQRFVLLGASADRRLLAVMFVDRAMLFASSARGRLRVVNEGIMKKPVRKREGTKPIVKPAGADEILPEYDFSRASRNKYASRYAGGSVVVVLEPDVASALAGIIRKRRVGRRKAGTP